MARCVIRQNAKNRHINFRDDPDLHIRRHQASRYRMMLTPERENIIDAVFFEEMMYKGVDDDQRNWDFSGGCLLLSRPRSMIMYWLGLIDWRIHGFIHSPCPQNVNGTSS